MSRHIVPLLILLSLAACNRASDQPENATDDAPSAAAPSETTSATPAPSGNDSADATASGSATSPEASAAGGPTGPLGQTDAALDADLLACDAMPAGEQAACRADAQARYADRAASGAPEEATPVQQP